LLLVQRERIGDTDARVRLAIVIHRSIQNGLAAAISAREYDRGSISWAWSVMQVKPSNTNNVSVNRLTMDCVLSGRVDLSARGNCEQRDEGKHRCQQAYCDLLCFVFADTDCHQTLQEVIESESA
jgi:hypothetical protein